MVTLPDWKNLIAGLSWPWLWISLLLSGLHIVTGADKWRLWALAQHGKADQPYVYLRRFGWQVWIGQFVPLPVAVIAGRGISAARDKNLSWHSASLNGAWDQLFELLAMVCLIPVAAGALLRNEDPMIWSGLIATSLICYALWFLGMRRWGARWLQHHLLRLMLYSQLRVLIMIARHLALTLAIALPVSLLMVAAAMPVLTLLSLIPFTPGNLGIAEWGWVGLLGWVGENPSTVALYVICVRILVYLMQTFWLLLILGYNALNKRAA